MTARGHTPLRTCVGCGRKAPQHELVRLYVVADGQLGVGGGPGRGAYLHPRESCFVRARSQRRPLGRSLRARVTLSDDLWPAIAGRRSTTSA